MCEAINKTFHSSQLSLYSLYTLYRLRFFFLHFLTPSSWPYCEYINIISIRVKSQKNDTAAASTEQQWQKHYGAKQRAVPTVWREPFILIHLRWYLDVRITLTHVLFHLDGPICHMPKQYVYSSCGYIYLLNIFI